MSQTKMVTVKFKNGAVMRISEELGKLALEREGAHYVSKSCLRRFWKLHDKIEANQEYLKNKDFSKDQEKNFLHKEVNGEVFAYLHVRDEERVEDIIPEKKEIKELSWFQRLTNSIGATQLKPKEIVVEQAKVRLVTYPVYQRFLYGIDE